MNQFLLTLKLYFAMTYRWKNMRIINFDNFKSVDFNDLNYFDFAIYMLVLFINYMIFYKDHLHWLYVC